MVKALQGSYGVPGKEQLTAAIDLAQTKFGCCAINSNINYDTSLWRLQGYGQRDWAVPQTCCFLTNRHGQYSYLDPKPVNLTQCQSLQRHVYESARHTDGCLDKLDDWYRQHYLTFLGVSLLVAIIEFGVLLSVILSCTRLPKSEPKAKRVAHRTTGTSTHSAILAATGTKRRQAPQAPENIYMDSMASDHSGIGSAIEIGGLPNGSIKEVYVQPPDIYKNKHTTTFKTPTKYQYQISKSYLV